MDAGYYIQIRINPLGVVKGQPYRHRVGNSQDQGCSILDPCFIENLLVACISVDAGNLLLQQLRNGFGIKIGNKAENVQLSKDSGYIAAHTAMTANDYVL